MKLGHFAADSHPGNVAVKMFAEAVEKRTNGTIKVAIYPNNALGSPPEVLEQNILGAVDMSLPTQGQLGKYSKKFNCVMLPFMFDNYAQADKVLDGPFIEWAVPDLEKAGLVFLSNWEWGFRNLTNRQTAGEQTGGREGSENTDPAGAAHPGRHGSVGGGGGHHQLQRAADGAEAGCRGRPGEPGSGHFLQQALRNAEVSRHDGPQLQHDGPCHQQEGLGQAHPRAAEDRKGGEPEGR